MWRILREVVVHILSMCVTIIEDVEFLKELKRTHMTRADFTPQQIQDFEEVDDRTLTNWKNSLITSILTTAPPRFRLMMPFKNWHQAVAFLEESLKKEAKP